MSHVDDGTLHAYLDGELSPVERARVDAHVADCPPCRERLAEERSLIERADALLALAAPAERPAPPLHQLRAPRPRWRFRLPLAWAATITLAFIAGWQLRPASPMIEVAPRVLATVPTLRANAPTNRQEEQRRAPSPTADGMARRAVALAPAANADAAGAVASPPPSALATPGLAAGESARPELHGQPAAPIPQSTVLVTPSRLDVARRASAKTTAIGTTWPVIEAEPARRVLGAPLASIPGFPIRDIRQSPGTDSTMVMVEQQLDAETVVQIYQTRTADMSFGYAQSGVVSQMPADPLGRTVRSLRVHIAGPLSADSLLKLLSLVK